MQLEYLATHLGATVPIVRYFVCSEIQIVRYKNDLIFSIFIVSVCNFLYPGNIYSCLFFLRFWRAPISVKLALLQPSAVTTYHNNLCYRSCFTVYYILIIYFVWFTAETTHIEFILRRRRIVGVRIVGPYRCKIFSRNRTKIIFILYRSRVWTSETVWT